MSKKFNNDKMYPMDDNFVTVVNLDKDVFFEYFLVDDRTKTLILGDGVDSWDNSQGILSDTQIESIILEGRHETLLLIDGILYERTNDEYYDFEVSLKLVLCFIPPKMKINKYVVPEDCIEFATFSICNNYLKEIVFHNNFLFFQDMCFADCLNIKSINLPKSLKGIGEYPLDISGLENIMIDPENTNYIVKNNALLNFEGSILISIPCGRKEEVFEIPEGVISVEEYLPCNSFIKKLILPNTLPSFTAHACCEGNSMMFAFPSIEECIIKDKNPYLKAVDGVVYSKDLKKLVYYPVNKKCQEYTLIDSCVSIEISSFIEPKYLKKVFIPNRNFKLDTLLKVDYDSEIYVHDGISYILVDYLDLYIKYDLLKDEV